MEKVYCRFEGINYDTLDEAVLAVMESHPELLDDDMSDFCDNNIEEID